MAALVIAAAGSALGGAVLGTGVVALGLTGNAIGYLAGSLLANAFTPTQKSEGPRLNDLKVTGSSYGSAVPYVLGHPRIAGQVVWASDKIETATTTSQGKGGGGSEYTSYSYSVNAIILLTENVTGGVRKVWKNSELVFSSDPAAGLTTLFGSGAGTHWTRMTAYTGASDQLPDPVYEAAVGVDNADAYRGRTTVFIEGWQLGSSGQLDNLEFEIAPGGSKTGTVVSLMHFNESTLLFEEVREVATSGSYYKARHLSLAAGVGASWETRSYASILAPTYNESDVVGYPKVMMGTGSLELKAYNYDLAGSTNITAYTPATSEWDAQADFTLEFIHNMDGHSIYNDTATTIYHVFAGGNWHVRSISDATGGTPRRYRFAMTSGDYVETTAIATKTVPHRIAFTRKNGVLRVFVDGVLSIGSSSNTFNTALTSSGHIVLGGSAGPTPDWAQIPNDFGSGIYDEFLFINGAGLYEASYTPLTTEFPNVRTVTVADSTSLTEVTLQDAVSAICVRSGLSGSEFDVSALSTITKPVRSLAVSPVSSARSVLDMLADLYFFTSSTSNKVYFRPLGGASAATIPYSAMGWSTGGDVPESLAIKAGNELEIPAMQALTYSNVDADYQPDTQYSDRLLTAQGSTSVLSSPIGLTATEAKQTVDARVMLGFIRAFTTQITLGQEYAHIEAGDSVLAIAEDSSQYRLFLASKNTADGVHTFDAMFDDASVLTQTGATAGGTQAQTIVQALSTTSFELLDIALLRDADDRTGHYVAIKGDASNWRSAALYLSFDDVSYTQLTTVGEQAVMGTAATALPVWTGGNVWDLDSTLTVSVGFGELSSYTEADVINGVAPGYLIGDEIVYAQTATLVSAGVYTLSRFLRYRRGTEWATTHEAGERFVVLGTSGMRFIPMDASELGKLRYYKAVSAGQRLSDVAAKQITPMGVNQEPFAGVNARADRDTTDTGVTWDRRTRLSTRITGPLAWSNPVGELPESYEVDVYTDGTFTTVARTLTASTPAVTYTSANQITDFGSNQATLYLRIYQLSATVGRGYALQATI